MTDFKAKAKEVLIRWYSRDDNENTIFPDSLYADLESDIYVALAQAHAAGRDEGIAFEKERVGLIAEIKTLKLPPAKESVSEEELERLAEFNAKDQTSKDSYKDGFRHGSEWASVHSCHEKRGGG